MSDIQQLNPSETATIQNASEFSEETVQTVQNTQSLTITNDSNLIQVPTHNITQDETNNQNQDNSLSTTRDNTSILSTSHTNVTQPSQTQRSPRQTYHPPSIPPQFSTQIHTHNAPQQGSYNTQHTNTVHFQTPTPTNNNRPNSLNTFPSSQTSSTITPTLQNSHFQIPNPPSTNIRTNPHFHNTPTISFTNISNVPTCNTVPPSTISRNTISQPTYINSSTSISEPMKLFDSLDYNYTPE